MKLKIDLARQAKWIAFGAGLFLLCFRALPAFRLYTDIDDLCYATWTAKLLGMHPDTCIGGDFPPGSGVLWSPAGILTLFSSGWNPDAFFAVIPIWVGALSFFYWVASGMLFGSMLFLLNIPVLYYATHRTTMIHAPEIFLAALLVWVSIRGKAWWSLVLSVLLMMLRLNDVPGLLFPLVLFLERRSESAGKSKNHLGLILASVAGVVALGIVAWISVRGYHSTRLPKLISDFSFARASGVFVGADWGLLWTAPFWLFCLGFGAIQWKQLGTLARVGLAWMGFEGVICLFWKGNGSDFAYRYLIGSYAGAFLIWQEIRSGRFELSEKIARVLARVNAVWLFWLTWIYKESADVLPYAIRGRAWTHPELQVNSLKALLSPERYLAPLLHSPVLTLLMTAGDPTGPYSLSGQSQGLAFRVLLALVMVSLIGLIWAGVIRAKTISRRNLIDRN